jgi:asparagine synthase (glutamine-hydrolysing)
VLRDLLLSERSPRRAVIDAGRVRALLDRHRRGRDLDWQLWTLMSFELWCRQFLDSAAPAAARRASRGGPVFRVGPGSPRRGAAAAGAGAAGP